MSEQVHIVMPVRADGAQQESPGEVASAIQQSLHEKFHAGGHQETEQESGPLKKMIANQQSLYKYISWEQPIRTLGSYIVLLGVLLGLRFLHPTQLILKIVATSLGVISVASLVSRSIKSDFVVRLRPEYKQVPESTLNAVLKDIHDLVQYSSSQAQKIIFGEDLGKTFSAFIGFTALFWLLKIVSPFSLAILGLTSLYIGPLIASARGHKIAQDARVRAQKQADATAQNAKVIVQDSKAKAEHLWSKVQQAVAQSGGQTATDTCIQASCTDNCTVSDIRRAATETTRNIPDVGVRADNIASDAARSPLSSSQQPVDNSQFYNTDGHHDSSRYNSAGRLAEVYPKVTVDGIVPRYD